MFHVSEWSCWWLFPQDHIEDITYVNILKSTKFYTRKKSTPWENRTAGLLAGCFVLSSEGHNYNSKFWVVFTLGYHQNWLYLSASTTFCAMLRRAIFWVSFCFGNCHIADSPLLLWVFSTWKYWYTHIFSIETRRAVCTSCTHFCYQLIMCDKLQSKFARNVNLTVSPKQLHSANNSCFLKSKTIEWATVKSFDIDFLLKMDQIWIAVCCTKPLICCWLHDTASTRKPLGACTLHLETGPVTCVILGAYFPLTLFVVITGDLSTTDY